jgi:hypothetical protein
MKARQVFFQVESRQKGAQSFFEFGGSKESSHGFAVAIDQARVDGSGVTGSRMDADENKAVRGCDGVFQDTKSIALLLSKESNLGRSSGNVGEMEAFLDVLAGGGGEKMTLP